MKNSPLQIGSISIQPGEKITLALPTPEIYTCAPIYIPVHVIHGKNSGPVLLVCGALHGDEINGVAITHRLLKLKSIQSLQGTLIVIPTLNIYGMMTLSRNLPDRRDLDGSFPGSETGSFASRLAYFLNEQVFSHISHCIDLHTGEPHISKLPQVKTIVNHPQAEALAKSFQAPVTLPVESKQGLLWLLEQNGKSVPTIIYETGEALRLDHHGIKLGVKGILRVMNSIGMITKSGKQGKMPKSVFLKSEEWIRSPSSGLCEIFGKVGAFAKKGDRLAVIYDPFGTEQKEEIFAPFDGIVISRNNLPILNEGEPMLQLAEVHQAAVESIQEWANQEKKSEDYF